MKSISCMDMGVSCTFVAEGATAEEAVAKLTEHAKITHPIEISKMTPEAMKVAMMAKVKEVTPPDTGATSLPL